jgi:hypothetical protein
VVFRKITVYSKNHTKPLYIICRKYVHFLMLNQVICSSSAWLCSIKWKWLRGISEQADVFQRTCLETSKEGRIDKNIINLRDEVFFCTSQQFYGLNWGSCGSEIQWLIKNFISWLRYLQNSSHAGRNIHTDVDIKISNPKPNSTELYNLSSRIW